MVTLREEYSKHKVEKNEALNEAAIGWVMDNVLILNESFNRESLQRLQQSISKFDATFAPYAARVPEIRACLDGAVDLMNSLTMGKNVIKKDRRLQLAKEEKEALKDPATYAVKYMSILYNTLSRFFNKDMRVVLGFPIFKVAVENPQTPLMDLADKDKMKAVLMHAMVPSKEIQPILHRMYRSMDLPSIDYGKIADELLTLSVSDFHDLMQIDKVPLVVSPEREPEVATSPNPKAQDQSELLDEDSLMEAAPPTLEQATAITQELTKISNVLSHLQPTMATAKAEVDKLKAKILQLAGNVNTEDTPNYKGVVATAQSIQKYFSDLGRAGPKIRQLLPEPGSTLSADDLDSIEKLLTQNTSQAKGMFGRFIALVTRAGVVVEKLKPDAMNAALMSVLRQAASPTPEPVQQRVDANPLNARNVNIRTEAVSLISEADAVPGAALKAFDDFFIALEQARINPGNASQNTTAQPDAPNQAETPAAAGGAAAAAPSAATNPSVAANQAAAPQANARGSRQTMMGLGPNAQDPKVLATSMAAVMGVPLSPTLEQQVGKLIGAGWKITPP